MKLDLSGKHVNVKTDEEIRTMRIGGLIWQSIKNYLSENIKIGMDLSEIEELTKAQFEKYGVKSSFNLQDDFPSILCLSVNECVVHGPATKGTKIQLGDKLTLDFGFSYQGLNIDAAFNLFFGWDSPTSEEPDSTSELSGEGKNKATETIKKLEEKEMAKGDKKKEREIRRRESEFEYLQQLTRALFYDSIQDLKANQMSGCISERMESFFKQYFPSKYSFLEKFTGHAIGRELHEYPRIHNFGFRRNEGERLPLHSTICIEPMIVEQEDGRWTRSSDGFGIYIKKKGGLTIHYEHVVLILEDGVEILTADYRELEEMKEDWTIVKSVSSVNKT